MMLAATKILATDSEGNTALHRCTIAEEALELIKLGFDVNAKNINGETPLHITCRKGCIETVKALLSSVGVTPTSACVQTAVNMADGNGRTPLHYACMSGHRDVAELLMSYDSDINAKDFGNSAPLHLACAHGRAEVAALLIDAGAIRTGENVDDDTPLDLCETYEMRAIFEAKETPVALPSAIAPARKITFQEVASFHTMLKKAEVMARAAVAQGSEPKDINRAISLYEAALVYVKEYVKDLHAN